MIDRMEKDLLFELGIEEIPARFAAKACGDLKSAAEGAFKEARLKYKAIKSFVTPRRLTLYVSGLEEYQASVDRRVKGPSVKAAFDHEGKPSRAAEGFARSQGVGVNDLIRLGENDSEYVYAIVHEEGKRIDRILPGLFDAVLKGLAFPKNMRWGSSDFRFVRPIRWIALLWGEELIPMQFEGIASDRSTYGHRTISGQAKIGLACAEEYLKVLMGAGVVADQDERKAMIRRAVLSAAESISAEAVIEEDLLEEINYIVEWPTAFIGQFDEKFLKLPEICITTPMQGHQRYFPVKRDGRLLNKFIAVRNGDDKGIANVRHGNERVLSARLEDAKFFFDEDRKKTLEQRTSLLDGITFADGLGSMKDKSDRMAKLAEILLLSGDADGAADEEEVMLARKAAALSKCDLTTNMVREFTELQGEIGMIYAELEGHDSRIARAIMEHYLPKASGLDLPASRIGSCLAMADKADSLAGYFGIGRIPTGSADPYALRRSALGLIAIHEARNPGMGLMGLMKEAVDINWPKMPDSDRKALLDRLVEFLEGRLKGLLLDEGHRYDLVDSAMQHGCDRPATVRTSLGALEKDLSEGWMEELAEAFVRVRNIAKGTTEKHYSWKLLTEEAEINLARQYEAAASDIDALLENNPGVDEYATAMRRYSELKPSIDRFFTDVMVNCEDEMVRKNRLGLVKALEGLALRLADFSRVDTARKQA
ncbi:MAG: glycine--tRNA ligase subunit beta [Firmicutes bacterium]|nr:glycine--tRNA ligase subunit beta [Bacillota bacterium]